MKKVSELAGVGLDYWVAQAQGYERVRLNLKGIHGSRTVYVDHVDVAGVGLYRPSTSWSHGGPIIERERITVFEKGEGWAASMVISPSTRLCDVYGRTHLEAAMRAYVASVYGEYVDD